MDSEAVAHWVTGTATTSFNGGDKGDGGELGKAPLAVKLDGVIHVGRMLAS